MNESSRRTVLFVSSMGGIGGPARSLLTVIRHLPADIRPVLAAPKKGKFIDALGDEEDHFEHWNLAKSNRRRWLTRMLASMQVLGWAVRHRKDLLAVHANGQSELMIVTPVALILRVRTVVWMHTSELSRRKLLLRGVWRRASAFRWLAVSELAAEVIAEAGLANRSRIEIVPNPIDPLDVLRRSSDTTERDREFTVGYLGSTARSKGFDFLPRIVAALSDYPVHWLLFGPHPEKAATESERAVFQELGQYRSVKFLTKLTDVRLAYEQCDVILCPSRKESFGRVAAEAMLNGIPVVATDIPAFQTLIGQSGAGLLFPISDVERAAELIRQIGDDEALRRAIGAKGPDRITEFQPKFVVDRLLDAYGYNEINDHGASL